ncbi:MAG: hypothetical protein R3C53_25115 [Pirellulaceae bacterium]
MPISRREFCGAVEASLAVANSSLFADDLKPKPIRVIAYNTSSSQPDLDEGRSKLLIGDLNHGPDTDEYKRWIDAGWKDIFAKVGTDAWFALQPC